MTAILSARRSKVRLFQSGVTLHRLGYTGNRIEGSNPFPLREPGPEGVAARKAVQAALDLKQTEFNAQGVEMNQRYESSAVIPDEGTKPEEWLRDRDLYNQPTTRPGAKIPHAWLVGPDGTRMSTLDVTGDIGWSGRQS